ncbi:Uncharacterised protein [Mycobacteroides abscessus subsp. abscessus]|nr:Uncharacterised protein [Mycobacteroides abscessus subsp. abscessus]
MGGRRGGDEPDVVGRRSHPGSGQHRVEAATGSGGERVLECHEIQQTLLGKLDLLGPVPAGQELAGVLIRVRMPTVSVQGHTEQCRHSRCNAHVREGDGVYLTLKERLGPA